MCEYKKMFGMTKVLLLLVILTVCGCFYSKQVTFITSVNYNEEVDRTEYLKFPYGSISMKGKWEKGIFDGNSSQQYFSDADGVLVSAVLNSIKRYEFNPDGTKTGMDFLQGYYIWDTDYLIENSEGLQREVLETDSANNILIYRLFKDDGSVNMIMLTAERNGIFMLLSVGSLGDWNEAQAIDFLKDMWMSYKL